jgi:hypothetical protein
VRVTRIVLTSGVLASGVLGSGVPQVRTPHLGHLHGAASHVGTGTYWFAIGLLVGILLSSFGPAWLRWIVFTGDLVALGWSVNILHYADTGTGRWVLIAVAFLLIGMFIGVVNGLRHLGDAEMRARLTNIRRIGRYF